MTIENFERLNAPAGSGGRETYLNPRNTAAGSLRQLDSWLTASRPLDLLTYLSSMARETCLKTQWDTSSCCEPGLSGHSARAFMRLPWMMPLPFRPGMGDQRSELPLRWTAW
jgi:hypothetical protein